MQPGAGSPGSCEEAWLQSPLLHSDSSGVRPRIRVHLRKKLQAAEASQVLWEGPRGAVLGQRWPGTWEGGFSTTESCLWAEPCLCSSAREGLTRAGLHPQHPQGSCS